MEEDIKILEEMIENADIEDTDMNDCFGGEHIEAIENLLNAYKKIDKDYEELEQAYEKLKEENEHYTDSINALETYYDITEEDLENRVKEDR